MYKTKRNISFSSAKLNKKDEFFTSLRDIENEIKFYPGQFQDKVVYCNCDDPRSSNFVRFFLENFISLGLRKLIATSYAGTEPTDDNDANTASRGLLLIKEAGQTDDAQIRRLKGNGDFESDECIGFLQEADIVVTNPPFSKFRKFFSLLIERETDFLILGNLNALTYKEVFPHFQSALVRYGPSIKSGDREFEVPADYPLVAAGARTDSEGRRFIRVKGVRWFTTLTPSHVAPELPLSKKYRPDEYPVYANYDAIHVARTKDIPADFAGPMGVPITFMDKYNPNQFEILGSSRVLGQPIGEIAEPGSYVAGGPRFYLRNDDGTYRRLYDRLVVRNLKPE